MAGASHYTMLGLSDGTPTGLVDIEIGADNRAAFAIVVAPDWRRSGLGRALVDACLADPRFDRVCEWFARVETGNFREPAIAQRCGFTRMTAEDAEGFSYFARRLGGWPPLPWRPSWSALPEARSPLTKSRCGAGRPPTASHALVLAEPDGGDLFAEARKFCDRFGGEHSAALIRCFLPAAGDGRFAMRTADICRSRKALVPKEARHRPYRRGHLRRLGFSKIGDLVVDEPADPRRMFGDFDKDLAAIRGVAAAADIAGNLEPVDEWRNGARGQSDSRARSPAVSGPSRCRISRQRPSVRLMPRRLS